MAFCFDRRFEDPGVAFYSGIALSRALALSSGRGLCLMKSMNFPHWRKWGLLEFNVSFFSYLSSSPLHISSLRPRRQPQNPSRFKTRCHRGPDNKLPSHPTGARTFDRRASTLPPYFERRISLRSVFFCPCLGLSLPKIEAHSRPLPPKKHSPNRSSSRISVIGSQN